MKSISILFFASLKDATGKRQDRMDLPDNARVLDLKAALTETYKSLEPMMHSMVVSVNREFADDTLVIPDNAEVAIFPPVSGGSFPTIIRITEDILSMDELLALITLPTTGAACFFTGMVRQQTQRGEEHETSYLEYETYQTMAELKMRQVADEIRTRWSTVEGIAIVQRIGKLFPATPTVMIACSAGHRDTGVFEAARYGIDRLKEIVPIWKKEISPEGQTWVEGDYFPKPGE